MYITFMISIKTKNILNIKAEILVLSANPSLLAGSGVSGVIHKVAGPQLEIAAKAFAPISPGEAIITPGFNLSAKCVIHTVCPRYLDGNQGEEELLAAAYKNTLAFYNQIPDAKSIAFVSMGTGIYKWPMALAAKIAVKELLESRFKENYMCVLDEQSRLIYQSALDRYS
jgi:O-acetyl-ADP-ribose deacetylase (regulator of RNase III)